MTLTSVLRRCRRKIMAGWEGLRYALVAPVAQTFVVVTCERNAGDYAMRCLDSVYSQRYQRNLIRHIFIDDASNDGTHEKILAWLSTHPGHCVEYIHHQTRRGGTANTLDGIGRASGDAVVIELNGDDWLPDPLVFDYLSRIYAEDAVWMTYNTCRVKDGPPADWARAYTAETIKRNAFRDVPAWSASHLHTFRKKLFNHLDPSSFNDPLTGEYWECADDQAIYFGLLELSGQHSRHLYRVTCIYNFWEASHSYQDSVKSVATADRVRQAKRYEPLPKL